MFGYTLKEEIRNLKKDVDRLFDIVDAVEKYLGVRIEFIEYPKEVRCVKEKK